MAEQIPADGSDGVVSFASGDKRYGFKSPFEEINVVDEFMSSSGSVIGDLNWYFSASSIRCQIPAGVSGFFAGCVVIGTQAGNNNNTAWMKFKHSTQSGVSAISSLNSSLSTVAWRFALVNIDSCVRLGFGGLGTNNPKVGSTYRGISIYGAPVSSLWSANAAVSVGDFIIPTTSNGIRYKATTAGNTGTGEPSFPTSLGATVIDGGVTWECHSNEGSDNWQILVGSIAGEALNHRIYDTGVAKTMHFVNCSIRFTATTSAEILVEAGSNSNTVTVSTDPAQSSVTPYACIQGEGAGTTNAQVCIDTFYLNIPKTR